MAKQVDLDDRTCPKCQGKMETGELMSSRFVNFISDAEIGKLLGRARPTTAYRCVKCGYCEIYANSAPRMFGGLFS
jgi:hypothetical protein